MWRAKRAHPAPDGRYTGGVAEVERRRGLWYEVIALALWDPIANLVYGLSRPPSSYYRHFQFWGALSQLFSSLGRAALLLFIVWNSGDSFENFGLRKFRLARDLGLAVVLFAGIYVCFHLPFRLHKGHYESSLDLLTVTDAASGLVLVLSTIAAAFVEELLFRGILLTRLEELLNNVWAGILISAALFAGAHAYQSLLGVVSAFAMGLFYGIVFAKTRSIWPMVIGHTFVNLSVYFKF